MKWYSSLTPFMAMAILHLVRQLSFATVIHVPDNFETIQAAIDTSLNGDTVLVAQGEYHENINFNGKDISVVGNPDNPQMVIINGGDDGSVVRVSSQALLSGFTITNGSARFGGGIDCSGSPTLRNLYISDNEATSMGGGIYCTGNLLRIQDVVFDNNSAGTGGGGIFSSVTELELQNVSITQNTADVASGAFIMGDRVEMTNVLISANSAGGGVALSDVEEAILNKVTIVDNGRYGLIQQTIANRVATNITNSIITDDIALYLNGNAILWNTLNISYTDLYSARISADYEMQVDLGAGIINDNPDFVDPDEGDYHLTVDSPCIDAGDPNSPRDPDGTRADMGAFYYNPLNGISEYFQKEFPREFYISSIYPNPFNSSTTINYGLSNPGNVLLQVYNPSGQQITTLYEGNRPAGVHSVSLYANNLPTGLYFIQLKAADQVFTQKVMLIR